MKAVQIDEVPTLILFANLLEAFSELLTELLRRIYYQATDPWPLLQAFTEFVFKVLDLAKEYVRDQLENAWYQLKEWLGIED